MKKQRYLKVSASLCKPMSEFNRSEHIVYIGSYMETIKKNDYLIDIIQTENNNFYVRTIDVTDNKYDEIPFDEFKRKYTQPTLFDFLDI